MPWIERMAKPGASAPVRPASRTDSDRSPHHAAFDDTIHFIDRNAKSAVPRAGARELPFQRLFEGG